MSKPEPRQAAAAPASRVLRMELTLAGQRLRIIEGERVVAEFPVSTASNGPGEFMNSECTPRGWHVVRAKIGNDAPVNAVFVRRRMTGEIYTPAMRERFPDRDWILTRILWLSGLEPGRNRLGDVDTMRRFIYIHGCPDEVPMGVPGSKGCIRMRNRDVVELFQRVPVGTRLEVRD